MRDLFNHVHPLPAIPCTRVADNTPLVGSVIDTMGFASLTFVILAGTLELMPLTGITLPFVSYGGSSVVVNFLIIGLLMRISHEEHPPARA